MAGVRRLDRTGAAQATAAPAPILLSILRREIRFSGTFDVSILTSFLFGLCIDRSLAYSCEPLQVSSASAAVRAPRPAMPQRGMHLGSAQQLLGMQ